MDLSFKLNLAKNSVHGYQFKVEYINIRSAFVETVAIGKMDWVQDLEDATKVLKSSPDKVDLQHLKCESENMRMLLDDLKKLRAGVQHIPVICCIPRYDTKIYWPL